MELAATLQPLDLASTRDLLMRADHLDEASFESAARAEALRLFRLAARLLGNTKDAEDVVQEALVRAYMMMKERRFDARATVGTWLHRVVVNLSLDHLRAQRRRPEDEVSPELPSQLTGEAQIEAHLALRQLAEALQDLTPEQRTVVVLKDLEGYQTAEIAASLNVSEGAVEQRLLRARLQLRRRLSHE